MIKTIAVLMTVFNRKDKTIECLNNLFEQDLPDDYNIKVYIVDDGSTDGTSEAVEKLFPKVMIIQGDGNLYWNRGMHKCWSIAKQSHHDYYLWLNDDTILYKNALSELIHCFNVVNSIIVGACCSKYDNTLVTYGAREREGLVAPNGQIQPVTEINGNVVLIPTEIMDVIGINDPYYHHAAGDNEYGYRAEKAGYKTFLSRKFVGTCERHDTLNKCYDPQYPLIKRLKMLNTPFGARPKEHFHLMLQYFGLVRALKSVLYIYYKCLTAGLKR